ncbi:hypothetical protein ANO11243_012700 [Dothideomycetidae sp. 11243]|nr:hypothetical protein ANO11243_012700 [fungal sp. No.11243]
MELDNSSLSSEETAVGMPWHGRLRPTRQVPLPQDRLPSSFRNMHDVATILVGPLETKYMVHSQLLTAASPLFAAMLNGNFAEAEKRSVTLPEERPELFDWFVHWLYTGSLTNSKDCSYGTASQVPYMPSTAEIKRKGSLEPHHDGELRNPAGMPKYFLLIDLYMLSDRLLTTNLSNHIVDTFARMSEMTNSVPTPSDTWLLYGDCASFRGLHHCACRSNASVNSSKKRCRGEPGMPAAIPCPRVTSIERPGIRATAPLRELILDLFTYKKTDRLLEEHEDDWHPLFMRDLLVRMKRPGFDSLARHTLQPWLPHNWEAALSCEACRSVIGPGSTLDTARTAIDVLPDGNMRIRHGNSSHRTSGTRTHPTAPDKVEVIDLPRRCTKCLRVYCAECLTAAHNGALEVGDPRFALSGGDIGVCKPWITWEDDWVKPQKRQKGDGVTDRAAVLARRSGICSRYHEHGPMGAKHDNGEEH